MEKSVTELTQKTQNLTLLLRFKEFVNENVQKKRDSFWIIFLALLLSFTIYIPFLRPFPQTFLLALFPVLGIFLTYCWKEIGLYIHYAVLTLFTVYYFKEIPPQDSLWTMGIIFSGAVEAFIALLAMEEMESASKGQDHVIERKNEELQALDGEIKTLDEKMKALMEELEKWKEEAKHRKIDKLSDEKKLNLAYAEIEMLGAQKEGLLDAAYIARKESAELFSALSDLKELIAEKESEAALLRERMEELKMAPPICENCILQKEKIENQSEEILFLQEEKKDLEERKEKELFLVKEELSLREETLQEHKEQLEVLSKEKEELLSLKDELQIAFEESQSFKEANQCLQEEINALRSAAASAPKEIPSIALEQELGKTSGLYKQLKKQFEEKTNVLSTTRELLFKTEGKLLELQKESDLSTTITLEEEALKKIEAAIAANTTQQMQLEEEVTTLEAIISELLHSQ